jgi:hypothetical protein
LRIDGKVEFGRNVVMASAARNPTLSLCGNTLPHFREAALAVEDLRFWIRRVHDKIVTGKGCAGCVGQLAEKEKALIRAPARGLLVRRRTQSATR